MCFSPESSFTSSALLGILAYACAKKVTSKAQYPLVGIVAGLALMQFFEGFTWLAFEHHFYPSFFIPFGTYYTFLFGFVALPLLVSSATYLPEANPRKRIILKYLFYFTCLITLTFLLLRILSPLPLEAQVNHRSIDYSFNLYQSIPFINLFWTSIIFFMTMFLCIFFSSIKGRWIAAGLNVAAILITLGIYKYAIASVWCFFSVVSVGSIYFILEMNAKKKVS